MKLLLVYHTKLLTCLQVIMYNWTSGVWASLSDCNHAIIWKIHPKIGKKKQQNVASSKWQCLLHKNRIYDLSYANTIAPNRHGHKSATGHGTKSQNTHKTALYRKSLLMKHVANLGQTNMSQVADHVTTLMLDGISKWNEDRTEAYTMAEQISRSIGKQHVETALAQVVLWVAKAITLWHHRLYQAIWYFGQSATKTIIAEGHWEQQNPRHILRQVTVIFYSVWKNRKNCCYSEKRILGTFVRAPHRQQNM